MDAQLLTVQKLEEKERALQGSLGGVEKELTLRSQALELNKRKVRPGCGRAPTLPVLTPGSGRSYLVGLQPHSCPARVLLLSPFQSEVRPTP